MLLKNLYIEFIARWRNLLCCSRDAFLGIEKTHRNICREAFNLVAGCTPMALFKGLFLEHSEYAMSEHDKQPSGVFYKKKMLLKISQYSPVIQFRNNTCVSSLLLTKKTCSFSKKRLPRRCFPFNFAKFFKAPFLKDICKWLLLEHFRAGTGIDRYNN